MNEEFIRSLMELASLLIKIAVGAATIIARCVIDLRHARRNTNSTNFELLR